MATQFDYDYRDEEIAEISTRAKKLAPQVQIVLNHNRHDDIPYAALPLRPASCQIATASPRQSELY